MIQPAARTWRKKQILDLQSSWRKSHLNWPLRGRQVGCFFFNQRIISLQGWVGFSCKTVSISYTYTHIPSLLILPPLHPTPTSQSTELRSLCYQQLPTSCLFTHGGAYIVSAALRIHPNLSFPCCVQQCVLYIWAGAFICCFSFVFYKQRIAH